MSILRDSRQSTEQNALLSRLNKVSPFTIPSGIVTTIPAAVARIARDVPHIGFLTTKTISVEPREGYREPILHEYYPGCFVNAVGLANPGAHAFLEAMRPLLPLHHNKPLVVSIMGTDAQEFLECALILEPIADAFELNLSCPHVKGAGQSVGSDPEAVRAIVTLLKERLSRPVIPKLSPNLGDIPGMARLCRDAGADGLSLINTVGPGIAADAEGNPILTNITGGLSGAGILPVGLKAVREAASAVNLPIIASGGISTAQDVLAYRQAGASLFAVGSALAGMTTLQIVRFFAAIARSPLKTRERPAKDKRVSPTAGMSYLKTRVAHNKPLGQDLFELRLEDGPPCDPGRFFFLRLPGIGEKPFSPSQDRNPTFLVRTVGPFTRALRDLKPGDPLFMRGPYGKGFPKPSEGTRVVLIGGGTGAAPLVMAGARWREVIARAFFGFSSEVAGWFIDEIGATIRGARIVIDPPDTVGHVLKSLADDLGRAPSRYEECAVFLCGPDPMMRAAVQLLKDKVPIERIFVAREDIMRCGIGICGSCGTETGLRSCVDGPVMRPE